MRIKIQFLFSGLLLLGQISSVIFAENTEEKNVRVRAVTFTKTGSPPIPRGATADAGIIDKNVSKIKRHSSFDPGIVTLESKEFDPVNDTDKKKLDSLTLKKLESTYKKYRSERKFEFILSNSENGKLESMRLRAERSIIDDNLYYEMPQYQIRNAEKDLKLSKAQLNNIREIIKTAKEFPIEAGFLKGINLPNFNLVAAPNLSVNKMEILLTNARVEIDKIIDELIKDKKVLFQRSYNRLLSITIPIGMSDKDFEKLSIFAAKWENKIDQIMLPEEATEKEKERHTKYAYMRQNDASNVLDKE